MTQWSPGSWTTVINDSRQSCLPHGICIAVGDNKETQCYPNKVSIDCDKHHKRKRVDMATDAFPVRQRPTSHGVIRDGLPKEVTCELIPQM